MRSRFVLITGIMILALILAACTATTADDAADDAGADDAIETPIPETPQPSGDDDIDADDAQSAEVDDRDDYIDTPEGIPRGIIVEPDDLILTGANGDATGIYRSFFWTDEQAEMGLEIDGYYFPLQDEPLLVEAGETLELTADSDSFPDEITIEVFERDDDNFFEDVNTRLGELDSWRPESEPVFSDELDPENPVWTVDVPAGEYFIRIHTLWPTDEMWTMTREADYGFWIEVQ